eukprot:162938-Prorocentrum_lima.AAC.1
MTSSLVGSEMCIRDRVKTHGGKEGQGFIRWLRKSAPQLLLGAPLPLALTCLLYTSDAADDM